MSETPAPSETAELLGQRSYLLFIGARFAGTLGVQIQAVTIGWQVYQLARGGRTVNEAAFVLSMIGLIQFLPVLFLTLIAGQFADHHDRKNIMRITLFIDIIATLALAVLAAVRPMLWPIFVIAGVFGVSRAFMMPAGGSMVPMLVPRHLMPRALAWSSLSWQSSTIIGPAIGGLIITHSSAAAYAASAVLYVIGIVLLSGIRQNTRPEHNPASRWDMVKEGLAYVWREKIVFGAISLDLFAVLLGGATLLLPVFAADVLHVGAPGFGIMRAAPGVGAALVAAWLAGHPVKRKAGLVMFGGVGVFAIATIVFGAAQPVMQALGVVIVAFPLSVVALATLGGADMLSVYVRQTLVQIVTPDAMRGRVASVSGLFIGASNELGEFESGLVARFLGPVGAAIFGGVGALIVTGAWAKMFPALRKADKLTGD
jgi:MFS family permease